jgi:magnesium chelatase subunit I
MNDKKSFEAEINSSSEAIMPTRQEAHDGEVVHTVRSLRELIDIASGKTLAQLPAEESGLAEVLPFPFLALVGQLEMKLALLVTLINPAVGGVLLIGPRGTGKTTAIRSLVELLPQVPRSLCFYGCMPEDVETGGIDAICPACAQKYARGEPMAALDKVRLVELPMNARLDDVVGHIDERTNTVERPILHKGILAQADRNLLHVDEVNLLSDDVIDAILDAAAQGHYNVRRGSLAASYHSRFALIGSMNPEEGNLRPQILDRFGLRVVVRGLENPEDRLTAYRRVKAYLEKPRLVASQYSEDTLLAQAEIQAGRELLPQISLPEEICRIGLKMIQNLKVDSLRAEITLFEAARAYTALDGRLEVTIEDLKVVAPMALRMRRSKFMEKFLSEIALEDGEISSIINTIR